MIGGATVFGYIIGSLAALAKADEGVEALACQKRVEAYFDDATLNEQLKTALKEHYFFLHQERSVHNESLILSEIPNHLRKATIQILHGHLIEQIGLFSLTNYPEWFICMVIRMLEPQMRLPGEEIMLADGPIEDAYFVYEGECEGYESPSGNDDARNENRSLWDPDCLKAVYSPGCVFGVEGLAEGQAPMRLSVRAGEKGSGLYVLTQAATSELAHAQPVVFGALQFAVADMLVEQVNSSRTTWDAEMLKNKWRHREGNTRHSKVEPGDRMHMPSPAEPRGPPRPAG
jgi:hypothetical protein